MTLHVSKGLEFPVVALVGAGRMPAEGEDEREEARLFCVGHAGVAAVLMGTTRGAVPAVGKKGETGTLCARNYVLPDL